MESLHGVESALDNTRRHCFKGGHLMRGGEQNFLIKSSLASSWIIGWERRESENGKREAGDPMLGSGGFTWPRGPGNLIDLWPFISIPSRKITAESPSIASSLDYCAVYSRNLVQSAIDGACIKSLAFPPSSSSLAMFRDATALKRALSLKHLQFLRQWGWSHKCDSHVISPN